MTNEERLALIEANSYLYPTSIADLRWLISEVRRLQGEYARGRADERQSVLSWLSTTDQWRTYEEIERGEHVEATDATE